MKIMKDRILRTKVILGPIFALVLGATVVFTSAWSDRDTPTLSDQLFAQRIAGGYLVDLPDGRRILFDLNLGGSTHREASFDFAGLSGAPGLPFTYLSGAFGNWIRIGPRTIRDVELNFLFGEDGQVNLIGKTQVDIEFNNDLQTATGSYVSWFYTPDQDPLTDDPAIPGPSGDGLIVRKIN